MKYSYLYTNTSLKKIKQKLYAEIQSALHKKYGENPDPLILKRVKEEWNFLCKYHSIEAAWDDSPKQQAIVEFAFMHDLTRWFRHNNYPYKNNFGLSSSFIFYLLDASSVNPLPAHYHCPHCHKIYWKDDEYKDGFDLPPTKQCSYDNTTLEADGHNISWQCISSYRTHLIQFQIVTVTNAHDDLKSFLEQSWLSKMNSAYHLTPIEHPSILDFYCFHIDCCLEDTHPDFYKIKIDNSCRTIALRAWKEILDLNEDSKHQDLHEPFTFADLVYNLGIKDTGGTWDKEAKALLNTYGFSPSDLIVFYDDIFQYLTKHHITQRKAYIMADQISRGYLFIDLPKRLLASKDKWILTRIKQDNYFYPKAYALEEIFFALRTKIKDDQASYQKPYTSSNKNVAITCNLQHLPITEEDLQALPQKAEQIVELFNMIFENNYGNAHFHLTMPEIEIADVKLFNYGDEDDDLSEVLSPLSEYRQKQNRVVLYINAIYDHYKHAPTSDEGSKLKPGLVLSLAHALSTAIFFHFMGETQKLRKKHWKESMEDWESISFKDVVKNFGNWLEYLWCKRYSSANAVYQWRITQIKEEAIAYYRTYWPHIYKEKHALDDEEFLETIYADKEAISAIYIRGARKDIIYWKIIE